MAWRLRVAALGRDGARVDIRSERPRGAAGAGAPRVSGVDARALCVLLAPTARRAHVFCLVTQLILCVAARNAAAAPLSGAVRGVVRGDLQWSGRRRARKWMSIN